ncbi:MAG: hypothetical protein GX556_15520 [Fibrobacter sp.]|nr:hypothetical protein [Fibrobacter sp.]
MFKPYLFVFFLFSASINILGFEIPVTAHVDIDFTTTINLSQPGYLNETVGAVEFVFPIEEHLYKPIRNMDNPVKSFSIEDINITAPQISGSENATFSIRIAYRNKGNDWIVPLFHVNGITSRQFKNGSYSISKNSGLTSFNATLFSDVKIDTADTTVTQQFRNILFIIKVKADGPEANTINFNDLDLQVIISAKVDTEVVVNEEE